MSIKQSLGRDKNTKKVCLKKSNLKEIPKNLLPFLQQVTYMDLSHNLLTNRHLDQICIMCLGLRWLAVEDNLISIIPLSLGGLSKLEYLRTDWHIIIGDATDKSQLKTTSTVSIEQASICRIPQIKTLLKQRTKLVNIDGVRGVNFKIFCQDICKLELQQHTCDILYKRIESSQINHIMKEQFKDLLNHFKLKTVNSRIFISNPQNNDDYLKKLSGCFPLLKYPATEAKFKSSIRTERMSLDKTRAPAKRRQHNSFKSPDQKELRNISFLKQKDHSSLIVVNKVKEIQESFTSQTQKSEKTAYNSLNLIPLKSIISTQLNYEKSFPFHKVFAEFHLNPQLAVYKIQQMIQKGITPNCYDNKGHSPYHTAVVNNQLQAIKYTLMKNRETKFPVFNIELVTQDQKRNLLHFAAIVRDLSIISMLIQDGFPLHKRDKNGYRAIHLIDQNKQLLANYRKLARKRTHMAMQSQIESKGLVISRTESVRKQKKLIEMYEAAMTITIRSGIEPYRQLTQH